MFVCVGFRNAERVGAQSYTCMIEVRQSGGKKKKSDESMSAGATDSKTTSNILFPLVGCQRKTKRQAGT